MQGSTLLLLVVASFSSCLAQMAGLGDCPKVTVMPNFDPLKYLGKWYEAERYFAAFELGGKCNTANYSLNADGTITVLNSEINTIIGKTVNVTGIATINAGQPSKLNVEFPEFSTLTSPYWILDTDYKNYSVVWSCTRVGIYYAKFAWILTRVPQPSLELMKNAYDVLEYNGINQKEFIKSDQQDCPKGY